MLDIMFPGMLFGVSLIIWQSSMHFLGLYPIQYITFLHTSH